ncbi:PREDICTED: carboxypeptidase D-like, partial [Nicrophorus vespilloides]|uniref:Carboxypeptidase D-like n=1 Tax=Nicrophorus vespilloides TaxID=110193 RepID=A0ABM1MY06_NICVS
SDDVRVVRAAAPVSIGLFNCLPLVYHNNEQIASYLKNFTEVHKDISTLYSIGKSNEGVDLLVLRLTKNVGTLKPHVKLIGNIHGNEAIGREILLQFIEYLGENYKTNSTIGWLLDNTVIHVMPTMNPDGYRPFSVGICEGENGRLNGRNVDLNRDFSWTGNETKQPETEAVRAWLQNNTFVLSASLHSGALVVNYPYDTSTEKNKPSLTPDDDVFRHLSLSYARKHSTMVKGCQYKDNTEKVFKDGITNGAEWYSFTGGMQDYNYVDHGCMELTLELSCCKTPMTKDLEDLWMKNKEPLIDFCLQVHNGIKGRIIVDGNSKTKAKLKIEGRNIGFRTSEFGEFWRILLPGQYILQIEVNKKLYKVPFLVNNKSSVLKESGKLEVFLSKDEVTLVKGDAVFTTTTIPTTEVQRKSSTTPKPFASNQHSIRTIRIEIFNGATTKFVSSSMIVVLLILLILQLH